MCAVQHSKVTVKTMGNESGRPGRKHKKIIYLLPRRHTGQKRHPARGWLREEPSGPLGKERAAQDLAASSPRPVPARPFPAGSGAFGFRGAFGRRGGRAVAAGRVRLLPAEGVMLGAAREGACLRRFGAGLHLLAGGRCGLGRGNGMTRRGARTRRRIGMGRKRQQDPGSGGQSGDDGKGPVRPSRKN